MEYRIYKEADFKESEWTGGKTRQLAIFPQSARYLDRNFVWRLSSATCEQEETSFSRLPDYDRVLMVLEGSVVLAHQDVRAARLEALEQDRFDGAYTTKSFGKITDYNLMVAKGCQGFLDAVILTESSKALEEEPQEDYAFHTVGLYCREGYATVTMGGETLMLTEGQQLIADFDKGEKTGVSVMGEGVVIRSQIFYNDMAEELGPTVIPKEKASFDDFKTCIYLSNTQFRGAKHIIKKLKTQWFDEELTAAINKVERLYLPFFVTVLGFCIILLIGHSTFSPLQWILAVAGWMLIDFFVISPLIYLAAVPKPTRSHIKNIHELTPYEQKIYESQLNRNEVTEKILRKYKNAGKVYFDEDGNGYIKNSKV